MRRLGAWAATAMVVTQVVGVGIFLTPATMIRTLGRTESTLVVWAVMGTLSAAGALCYAELATRFPRAGGGYVFLREAFGPRVAFIYGWMTLLVIDPGLTAALGIGLAQYLLATLGESSRQIVPTAIATIVGFGLLTLGGIALGARVMRWTAAAKLVIVAALAAAAVVRAAGGSPPPLQGLSAGLTTDALASAVIAAFFAFGGWWELGRMAGEIESPQRTMPIALVGGIGLVTIIYALASVAFILVSAGPVPATDDALVSVVGTRLFGDAAGRLLAAMVVVAVAGSLAATLLGAPRVYLAMARDGVFPHRLARFDSARGTSPVLTLLQATLACGFVLLGTFNEILGYFVPSAVLFLGLSAAAVLVLPRSHGDATVFRAPLHPLPIVLFLMLIVGVLTLFFVGQPRQTMIGAAVLAAGIPVSYAVIRRPASLS
ncbi:MAG TPA: amino acid permease [Vicinamibacterales bacterium]|nr:amino acid permease [Vicinamibacterales bacterium]